MPWCVSGSLTHGGGANVPGIPGACATHNFTYLARSQWPAAWWHWGSAWAIIDLSSMKYCDIHLRAIAHEMIKLSIRNIGLQITIRVASPMGQRVDHLYQELITPRNSHVAGAQVPTCSKFTATKLDSYSKIVFVLYEIWCKIYFCNWPLLTIQELSQQFWRNQIAQM